jgi:hypothetical protein
LAVGDHLSVLGQPSDLEGIGQIDPLGTQSLQPHKRWPVRHREYFLHGEWFSCRCPRTTGHPRLWTVSGVICGAVSGAIAEAVWSFPGDRSTNPLRTVIRALRVPPKIRRPGLQRSPHSAG